MATLATNGDDRFSNFNILTTVYKTIGDHGITASILYPKSLAQSQQTPRPVLLRIHGGGWVSVDSLFSPFFTPWQLQLAERESAVIVTPNYRFIPEASIKDIIADIEDFWKWVHTSLPAYLVAETNGSVKLDLGRIMTSGDSAGGFLSLHLGLSHPDEIRAVTAAYPAIDMQSTDYTQPRDYSIMGQPTLPKTLMSDHVEKVRQQELETGKKVIVSSDPTLERAGLFFSAAQHGLLSEWFPPEQRDIHIIDRLQDGARFPRGGVFIWHGKQDTVIPAAGTVKLKSVIEEIDPGLNFKIALLEGEHGFDGTASIADEWMVDGLGDVVKAWLA